MAWTEGDGPCDQTEFLPPSVGEPSYPHSRKDDPPEPARTDWGDVIESAAAAIVVVVFVVTLCLMWLHKAGVL